MDSLLKSDVFQINSKKLTNTGTNPMKILQCNFTLMLFFKHFDWFNFFSSQSKSLKIV